MKKKLRIPYIEGSHQMDNIVLREALLANGCHTKIDVQSWDDFKVDETDVAVDVSLGYEGNSLCILFRVNEKEIRAVFTERQSFVHLDSCVEIFIGTKECYVNLEFNPFGTLYSTIGNSREGRKLLRREFFDAMGIWTEHPKDLTTTHNSKGKWEVLVRIPMGLTGIPSIPEDLINHKLIANLYKCGDKLQYPHYFSWNEIGTEQPDFHQSDYFGDVEFI